MVIGMGVSVLIARRGQADAPFIIIDKSCSPPENLWVTPCIPVLLGVNKWIGVPVKNAEV
jgi:hypothetical protein